MKKFKKEKVAEEAVETEVVSVPEEDMEAVEESKPDRRKLFVGIGLGVSAVALAIAGLMKKRHDDAELDEFMSRYSDEDDEATDDGAEADSEDGSDTSEDGAKIVKF